MKILSIHDGHNGSVGLFEDGKCLYAIQEERLTKKKNDMGFPINSVNTIMNNFSLNPSDIDFVSFNGHHVPLPFNVKEISEVFKKSQQKTITSSLKRIARRTPIGDIYRDRRKEERKRPIVKMGFKEKRIIFIDHHLAHASSAYFGSGWYEEKFGKILILTLDGGGDGLCATVSIGENGNITRLSETKDTESLGNIYSRTTFMLGFKPWEHEYKIMGMAPYVSKKYSKDAYNKFSSYLNIDNNDPTKFKRTIKEPTSLIYNRMRKDLEFQRFDSISRGLQDFTEDLIIRWIKNVVKKYKIYNLALSGGVFMNVKANKRIMELPEIENLFIFPSCGDETNIFGTAWYLYSKQQLYNNEKIDIPFGPLYLGSDINDNNVENMLKKEKRNLNINYEYHKDISEYVGELVAENKIVARASGGMEFGARALGNRSILSNASDLQNVQKINMAIKKRDFWMPFAPVILQERADDYIINKKNIKAQYMILSFDTTENRKDIIGAVHQADLTARPQLIDREWNPNYYDIVKKYEKETGYGGMMNTSFNLHGYPIVNDEKDALFVLRNSDLNYLQVGNYLIYRK